MKKFLIFLLPFAFGMSTAWAEISIQNDQMYIGDDGTLHIVGEIQNGLTAPLNQIEIITTLIDENGNEIDQVSTSSMVNRIMPNMKGPFDVTITGDKASMTNSYTLGIDYEIAEPKNQAIDVISSEFNRDNLNNIMVKGTVMNKGEITANMVSVVATFYDRDGSVAAVSRVHAEPDYLRANDEVFFLVSVPDKIQGNSVVDYSVVAESEEYTAVPEFPLGSMVLLAASVSAYIGLTKYSGRFITNFVSASNPK